METKLAHEKYCQSCSMPLEEKLLGNERDGSMSLDYCKYCYQNGTFVYPNLTLDIMNIRVKERMSNNQMPEEIVKAAIARLPELKRWREGRGEMGEEVRQYAVGQ